MKQIPMLDLKLEYEYMKKEIDSAIGRCLEHQQWILGPEVKELENKIAEYIGVKHCIGISSGTDALVLSLRALAIKLKGKEYFDKTDKIITTPFTFTATGDAILRAGATPVFVDIDPATYNIDPVKIREYLSQTSHSTEEHENVIVRDKVPKQSQKGDSSLMHEMAFSAKDSNKVVGIIPVHLYGLACQMDEIMHIAKEYNLFVLEDVAQAFGGKWKDTKLGSIGTTGCFSFFPSKNLGGFGDGGMVSTNDDELADLVKMLVKHGGRDKYNVDHIGYNARLDTLQAAILSAKIKFIDEFNRRRREIAGQYNKGLQDLNGFILPTYRPSPSVYHVYHQYTIRVLNGKRDELQKYLKGKGISTMVYYPLPLQGMKVFDGRCKRSDSLKESEKAAREVLSLPVEPLMENEEIKCVVETIIEFFQK